MRSTPRLAPGDELRDGAEVLLGHLEGEALDRFAQDVVDHPGEHLGLADGQLETLPAHRLDEDREGELAAALYLEGVRAAGRDETDRDVAEYLGLETRPQQSCCQLRPVPAGERRGVDPDRHRQAGLVDDEERQRDRICGVGERLADRDLVDARDGDELSGSRGLRRDPIESGRDEELGDADPLDRPVAPAPGDGLVVVDRALDHAADRQTAEVRRGVEAGDEGLEGRALGERGCREVGEERPDEDRKVAASRPDRDRSRRLNGGEPAVAGAAEQERDVVLLIGRFEFQEQFDRLVDDLGDPGVGAVDLVHDRDDRQPGLEGLAQHESRLGPGTVRRVDEQHRAVDHREGPLDLAAEVGVAGGVDDVQPPSPEPEGGLLGEDRDALLALEVEGVEDPVDDGRVGIEGTGLAEHRVDERRLTVIDVGDDRHVTQFVLRPHRHHPVLSHVAVHLRADRRRIAASGISAPGLGLRLLACRRG